MVYLMNGIAVRKVAWYFIFVYQAIVYGSYPILVNLSNKDGERPFNATAMNFAIEIIKLTISFFFYFLSIINNLDQRGLAENTLKDLSFNKSLYFSIPGFLYFINNNLSVFIQSYMDSASYQILCNFKILSTAILFYFIMRVKISKVKLFSICLLFTAGVIYIYGNIVSETVAKTHLFITKLGKIFYHLNIFKIFTDIYFFNF